MITLTVLRLSVRPSKKRIGSLDGSGAAVPPHAEAPIIAIGSETKSRRTADLARYCPDITE
jgi:hypothetical protein